MSLDPTYLSGPLVDETIPPAEGGAASEPKWTEVEVLAEVIRRSQDLRSGLVTRLGDAEWHIFAQTDMLRAFAARLAQDARETCETCRFASLTYQESRGCNFLENASGNRALAEENRIIRVPLYTHDGHPFGCRSWQAKV